MAIYACSRGLASDQLHLNQNVASSSQCSVERSILRCESRFEQSVRTQASFNAFSMLPALPFRRLRSTSLGRVAMSVRMVVVVRVMSPPHSALGHGWLASGISLFQHGADSSDPHIAEIQTIALAVSSVSILWTFLLAISSSRALLGASDNWRASAATGRPKVSCD
jgi:hypothetical protein